MRLLLVTLLALLTSCSSNNGSVAGGPGGQTTNGIVGVVYATGDIPAQGAKVTIRSRNFIQSSTEIVRSGELSNGAETVTDAQGRFEVFDLLYGSYMMEILIGDTLGRIDTFTLSEETETIDRGSISTLPVGIMTGTIDPYYLDNYDSVAVRIKGIERDISIELDGSYRVEGLAPWNYEVVVQGYLTQEVVSETVVGEVSSGEITVLEDNLKPINPDHYRAVRDFLDSCGLTDVRVHDVVDLAWNDVEDVILTKYGLEEIAANVNQLTFVKHLYLDSNKITEIPSEIGALNSLLTLNVRNNMLSSLPVELGDCIGITSLDISENNLPAFHTTVGRHTKMRVLNANLNSIEVFPDGILDMSFISTLNLGNNKISAVPESLSMKVPYLAVIDLNRNYIDTAKMDTALVNWISDRSVNDDSWITTQTIQ